MAKARNALSSSAEDRQLLSDYEKAQVKVHELESKGSPIEPEDKRAVADLHAKVAGSEVIKDLLKAQADYTELMNSVFAKIEQEVIGPISQTKP